FDKEQLADIYSFSLRWADSCSGPPGERTVHVGPSCQTSRALPTFLTTEVEPTHESPSEDPAQSVRRADRRGGIRLTGRPQIQPPTWRTRRRRTGRQGGTRAWPKLGLWCDAR